MVLRKFYNILWGKFLDTKNTEYKKMQDKIKESEEKYKSFFEKNGAAMFIIDPESFNIVEANNAACIYYGYTYDQMKSIKIQDINILSKDELKRYINDAKSEKNKRFYFKHKLSSGEIKDVEVYSGIININGKDYLYSIVHDITEKIMFEQKLMIQKSYFEQLFENSPDAIAILTNQSKVIKVNKAFETIFGYNLDEIKGKYIQDLLIFKENIKEYDFLTTKVIGGNVLRQEIVTKNKYGKLIYVSLLSYPIIYNQEQLGIYCIYTDISERKECEKKIEKLAYTDSLTGLYNRAYFIEKLNSEIRETENKKIMIMFIDIDGFKKINDTLGHIVGDEILRYCANIIKKVINIKGIVARIGGDEFVVLLKNITQKELVDISYEITEKLKDVVIMNYQHIHLSASIGASIYPDDGIDAHTLIKNADIAMYEAKKNNEGKVHIYSSQDLNKIKKEFILCNDIRYALDKGEIQIHFQPIVDISNSQVVGAEALARWYHKELGYIPPSEFIPIAEKNKSIIDIGNYIIKTVCKQNKIWQDMGYKKIFISINISAVQLQEDNFVDNLYKIIKDTGIDPRYIELEITERVYIEDIDNIIQKIKDLRDMGIKISIDDFGTGYSSLSQLSKLDVNKLKIDKSFIDNIKMIDAIMSVATILNLDVIAEGVENEVQLTFLKSKKCKIVQGYIYGKPVNSTEFEKYIKVEST
ncbi:PAS domain S-box-containing protein/diguanylate cyclase (GGDEF) domain-containing protein [Alkalithermobacter thermoalcaliphilus JW-YL-7 = DSM 7308]|uniref:Diguanylate cyclase/phosphodiesterase with PAS/PAC sensor(S) n=2 Tax=Clostridium paradoxum TaxID=29346 RepID=A0A150FTG2_CLOPD|nr:diguanylate cyclase/phosphodiesterase with PAS/PAC sensor(s) [[Clostridium] paradoxum JW-YL-7 = DSM 7308]SHL15811.1 PAS domain S-box-containing protein/diguanylate cyclase (GGDEF) domain-containing protein [[Clostridium] paradoxum JW-YL-7 = DSM 7308]